MRTTYVLSIHASYACRERGACCTAGWPIPVERHTLPLLTAAIASGRLRAAAGNHDDAIHTPGHAPADTPGLLAVRDGRCVFHATTGEARCQVHRTLGHAALPLACQQFPRVLVMDPRGVSVTLSHYCPTACELLDTALPLRIETRASPNDGTNAETGLDARNTLPPLLRPDMLMDWESWWRWERESVRLIDEAASASGAIARLGTAVEAARSWRPADGPLDGRVTAAFESARSSTGAVGEFPGSTHLLEAVWSSIPDDLRPARPAAGPVVVRPDVRRRFLAAHAFANWTAYLGHGLRSWWLSIRAADALIDHGFTPGQADLWLRHLADPKALAERLDAG